MAFRELISDLSQMCSPDRRFLSQYEAGRFTCQKASPCL